MNILAVYGTNYGQAEAVLRRIAAALEARGHTVHVHKGDALPAGLAVDGHDAVVIAASIVMGKHQAYIRRFVEQHRAALQARPGAFVSVNGAAPESDPAWRAEAQGYVDQFLRETGWQPRWTAAFSGALRFPRYGFVTRLIMRLISRQHGGPTDTAQEYEFTDWQAVDRFAAAVAAGLAGEPAGPGAAGSPVQA